MFITTVIVAYMAYTCVMCAFMHVLFPVRKFLLFAIAFALGKLRVVLKIADQSCWWLMVFVWLLSYCHRHCTLMNLG